MKKLHVYTVYMDDGDAFKVTVPPVRARITHICPRSLRPPSKSTP